MSTGVMELKRIDRESVGARRTRSGRVIYGLHPSAGLPFWTASADKMERRRVLSRIAHHRRAAIGPAPAPYRALPTPVAVVAGTAEAANTNLRLLVEHLDEELRPGLVLGSTLTTNLSPERP